MRVKSDIPVWMLTNDSTLRAFVSVAVMRRFLDSGRSLDDLAVHMAGKRLAYRGLPGESFEHYREALEPAWNALVCARRAVMLATRKAIGDRVAKRLASQARRAERKRLATQAGRDERALVQHQRKAKLANRHPGYPDDQMRGDVRSAVSPDHLAVARNDPFSRAWTRLADPVNARSDGQEVL